VPIQHLWTAQKEAHFLSPKRVFVNTMNSVGTYSCPAVNQAR